MEIEKAIKINKAKRCALVETVYRKEVETTFYYYYYYFVSTTNYKS